MANSSFFSKFLCKLVCQYKGCHPRFSVERWYVLTSFTQIWSVPAQLSTLVFKCNTQHTLNNKTN